MDEKYNYQKKIVENAVRLLHDTKKAAVVLPTGLGKSYIAAQVARQFAVPDESLLWIIPHTIINEAQKDGFLGSSYEDVVPMIETVSYAAAGRYDGRKPFLIILDEFHHVGAEVWGANVQALLYMYEDVPVLGLSATPFRPNDRVVVGDELRPRDMGDEFFEGNYAAKMYYPEAWERADIDLRAPKYVTAIYEKNSFEKTQKKLGKLPDGRIKTLYKKEYDAMRRNIERAHGAFAIFQKYLQPGGHYIFFCRNLTHMKEMRKEMQGWMAEIFEDFALYMIHYRTADPFQELQSFTKRDGRTKVLFAVDMVGEGIHVNCDGVILGRPTSSVNVEIQHIGRAAAVGKQSIIIDLVNNLTYAKHLQKAVADEIAPRNYFGTRGRVLPPEFTITDEATEYLTVIEAFNKKLDTFAKHELSEETIGMIIDAYLHKHAPLDFCLKYLNMNEPDFLTLVGEE